jgi:hypothetical protein
VRVRGAFFAYFLSLFFMCVLGGEEAADVRSSVDSHSSNNLERIEDVLAI